MSLFVEKHGGRGAGQFPKEDESMNVIEIRNLTKYYGKARGIIDVSFDVEEVRDLRLHRPERSRQEHNHPHPLVADPADRRLGDDLRQGQREVCA